jgi:cytochrome c oxidase subunit III
MSEIVKAQGVLSIDSPGNKSGGWWGIWVLIVTEGFLFGYLLFTYFYLASQAEQHWPPETKPELLMPAINTIILLSSSAFVWLSEYGLKRGRIRSSSMAMVMAIILGGCFVFIQLLEWNKKTYDMATSLYGSLFFTITGFHMLHVVVGLLILLMLSVWIALGYFNSRDYVGVTIGGLYWHFVDVVWLLVFTSLYLTPFLFQQ